MGEAPKMRLAKRLAFLGFDNSSGSERGEQPLSCNGDDRRLRRIQGGSCWGRRSAGHECRSRHEVDAGYRNPWGTFMLQLFAEGEAAPPALSEAQTRQAVASGTMKPDKAKEAPAVPQARQRKP